MGDAGEKSRFGPVEFLQFCGVLGLERQLLLEKLPAIPSPGGPADQDKAEQGIAAVRPPGLVPERRDHESLGGAYLIPDAVVVAGGNAKGKVAFGQIGVIRLTAGTNIPPVGVIALELDAEAYTLRDSKAKPGIANVQIALPGGEPDRAGIAEIQALCGGNGFDIDRRWHRIVRQTVGVDRDDAGNRGKPEAAVGAFPSRRLAASITLRFTHAVELIVNGTGDMAYRARREGGKGVFRCLEYPFVAAEPVIEAVILKHRENTFIEQSVARRVPVVPARRIAIYTLVVRADPDRPFPIPKHQSDAFLAQCGQDRLLVEAPPGEAMQSGAPGSEPEIIRRHFEHGSNRGADRLDAIKPVRFPAGAIKAVEATSRTRPEVVTLIFQKGFNL